VSRYQKGKTNLDFTESRDSEWQWYQMGHMQVCTSLQTDNHASTPPLSFFTGRMPFLPPNQQRQSIEGISTEGIKQVDLTSFKCFGQTIICVNSILDFYWYSVEVCLYPCVSQKSEPLNILQQHPQICSDLNKILHTQDDICYKQYYLVSYKSALTLLKYEFLNNITDKS